MVIRDQQLTAVGCGAVVLNGDGTGEMKRVYIDPTHRGQHLGETLLAALEDEALSRHCILCVWKRGSNNMRRCGFMSAAATKCARRLPPYTADPLSLFMEKALVVDVRLAAI